MAAAGMAAAYGVPVDVIRRTLKEFHLVNNGVSILLLILLTFLIKVVGIDAFH